MYSRADPEGGQEVLTPPPLEKSQKYNVSKQYRSGSPEKSQSYHASIQCWATIGPPSKRHLYGDLWLAYDGPLLLLFGSSLPSHKKETKTKKKLVIVGSPLVIFSGCATVMQCITSRKQSNHIYYEETIKMLFTQSELKKPQLSHGMPSQIRAFKVPTHQCMFYVRIVIQTKAWPTAVQLMKTRGC